MGMTTEQATTTLPRVWNVDGSPVVVGAGTIVIGPWYPEGVPWPSPPQGAANWANSLAQNINPSQQPGLL